MSTADNPAPKPESPKILRALTPADMFYANGKPMPAHRLRERQTNPYPYGPEAGYGDAEDDE